jgi:arginine repressor
VSVYRTKSKISGQDKKNNLIKTGVTEAVISENIIVLKVREGFSGAVANAVTLLALNEVLGTFPGEESVAVILRDRKFADKVLERIYGIMNE